MALQIQILQVYDGADKAVIYSCTQRIIQRSVSNASTAAHHSGSVGGDAMDAQYASVSAGEDDPAAGVLREVISRSGLRGDAVQVG